MNASTPLASMTTREASLSLYVVERDRDRLEKRRAEIMAELSARVLAHKSEQPSPTRAVANEKSAPAAKARSHRGEDST